VNRLTILVFFAPAEYTFKAAWRRRASLPQLSLVVDDPVPESVPVV